VEITVNSGNSRSSKLSDRFALGFIILFGLPFAGFGVAALAKGIHSLLAGEWLNGLFFSVFGLVFGGVGFGLWIGIFYASRAKKRIDAIKAAHPLEPWLWKDQWAGGSIRSSTKASMITACIFALFWNSISMTVCVAVIPGELRKGNHKALFALIFPAVGVGLLVWAVREIIRWKKFGESTFKMLSVPGVLGGQLNGAIQTSVKIRPEDGFHLKLRCINRVTTSSGNSSSTTENILWEDEKTMARELLADDPRRSGIPVYFQIPADGRESDDANSRNRILWRLEAGAKVPGVDYLAQFEVPVFRVAGSTAAAASEAPIADPTIAYQAPAQPYQLPAHSRIQVRETVQGGKEFIFPALLNPGVALVVALILAIFSSATWFMATTGKAPIFFPIVFGFVDLVIFLILINLLFKSSRITAEASGLTVTTRWLLFRSVNNLSPADIANITTKIGMTSGQNVYYDIHIIARAGRDITAASSIKDKKEADWLAAEMKRLLKLDKPAPLPTISP
jgi:hypothetical protein